MDNEIIHWSGGGPDINTTLKKVGRQPPSLEPFIEGSETEEDDSLDEGYRM